jgi:hypothetical protein
MGACALGAATGATARNSASVAVQRITTLAAEKVFLSLFIRGSLPRARARVWGVPCEFDVHSSWLFEEALVERLDDSEFGALSVSSGSRAD